MARDESSDPRQQAALDALERSHQADPQICPFGFYSADDFTGGAGMFHWYPTLPALLEALSRDLAFAFFDDDPDEPVTVSVELTATLAGVSDLCDLEESRMQALRACLNGVQDLLWVGTFAQLCDSEDAWTTDVRRAFRECKSEEDDDGGSGTDLARRIALEEVPDFIEFLREFGY